MAEGTLQFGRRVYDIGHKICSRALLENVNKQRRCAIRLSSLSAGCLLSDTSKGKLYGAENAVTQAAVVLDGYTRVTLQLCVNTNGSDRERVTAVGGCNGRNKHYPLKKLQVTFSERKLRQGWLHWAVRRTPGTARSVSRQQSLGGRYEWCVQGPCVFIRAYSDNGSSPGPLYRSKTAYYEILNVTPTATQAQIKTAYYKQSFIYHPDRNAGSGEATERFSEISESYMVLGNKALRKKYDQGLLNQSDLMATSRPSGKDTTDSTAKKQSNGRRSVMGTGQQRIYDFDKFYKEHYGEQLQRERDLRTQKEREKKKINNNIEDETFGSFMEAGLFLMVLGVIVLLTQGGM